MINVKDWHRELVEQNLRINAVGIGAVMESMCLEGKEVSIRLGRKSKLGFNGLEVDVAVGPKGFAGTTFAELFMRYNEEFIEVNLRIKQKVDELVEAGKGVFEAIVDNDIPELLMERMAGTQMGKEPQELVKNVAQKRFRETTELLARVSPPFTEVTWEAWIGKENLSIVYAEAVKSWILTWADLSMQTNDLEVSFSKSPLILCLQFIQNSQDILLQVKKFIAAMEISKKMLAT